MQNTSSLMPHFAGSGIGSKRAHETDNSTQESLLAMMDAVSGDGSGGGGTGAAAGDPAGSVAKRPRAISNNIHVRLQLSDAGDLPSTPSALATNTPASASVDLASSANFSRELHASLISQSYQNHQLQHQHQHQHQQQQHQQQQQQQFDSQQQHQQHQQYQLEQQQQQQQQTHASFSQMNAMYLQPIPIQPSNFSTASTQFFNSQPGNIGGIQKLLDSPHDTPHQGASLYGGHHFEHPQSQSQVPLAGTLFHRESGSSLSANNPQDVLLREYNGNIAEYPQHQQQQQHHQSYQLPSQSEYVPMQSFISNQHHQLSQSHDPNNNVQNPHHHTQHHPLENAQHHSDQLHQYHDHYQSQQQQRQNQHPQIPHGPYDAQMPHGYPQNQQQYISQTQHSTDILSTASAVPGIVNGPTNLILTGRGPNETPQPEIAIPVAAKKRNKKQQQPGGAKLSSKSQKSNAAANEKSTTSGTRPRNKWTLPELAALEAGMLRYGTNWAGLLADPDFSPALSSRTQMQCKDKAAVEKEKRMKEARRTGRMLSVEELGVWRYACDRKRNNVGMVLVTGIAAGGGSGRGVPVQQLQVLEQRPQEQQQLQQQHSMSAENLA